MKRYIATAVISALFTLISNSVWANQPAKCPTVDSIKSAGLTTAVKGSNGVYRAFKTSNYDTTNSWTFAVMGIFASSSDNALQQARLALSTLSGDPSPMNLSNEWVCLYSIGSGLKAVAMLN